MWVFTLLFVPLLKTPITILSLKYEAKNQLRIQIEITWKSQAAIHIYIPMRLNKCRALVDEDPLSKKQIQRSPEFSKYASIFGLMMDKKTELIRFLSKN